MDEFIKENSIAVAYSMAAVIGLLGSLLIFFLKTDRKRFMDELAETKDKVELMETEVSEIKENYNSKFEKVYEKQDTMKTTMNENHLKLMEAIHKVEIKLTQLNNGY